MEQALTPMIWAACLVAAFFTARFLTAFFAAGAFSVPRIISRGLQAEWFSQTIYNKFFESENSNVGAAYSFVLSYGLLRLVDKVVGLRVSEDNENIGLDLTQHRESAYTVLG